MKTHTFIFTMALGFLFSASPLVAQTADGEIVDATDPTKKDIVVVLTAKVAKDTPVPKIGNQEVRTGRTLTFKTNDFETIGNIESVKFS